MNNFIKVGSRIINLNQVAEVALEAMSHAPKELCVRIFFSTTVGCDDEMELAYTDFLGAEAEKLREFFSDPNHVRSLTPSKEEEAFQAYRDRGGEMDYETWGAKYRSCNELNKHSNPSDRQIDRISKLEQELLY
jgi:hypothetical protein